VDQVKELFVWRPLDVFCRKSNTDWRPKKFENIFPELVSTTGGIDDFPFEQLNRVLQSRLDEDYETLKILGAQFPVTSLLLIGSPVVLFIQFYIFLHLCGLNERVAQTQSFNDVTEPWIGYYRTPYARMATICVLMGDVVLIGDVGAFDALIGNLSKR